VDTRTIIAIGLFILVYFYFFAPQPQQVVSPAVNDVEKSEEGVASIKSSVEPINSELKNKIFELNSERLRLKINALGQVIYAELPNYKEKVSQSEPVSWNFENVNYFNEVILKTSLGPVRWKIVSSNANSINLEAKLDTLILTREISLSESSYSLNIRDSVHNTGKRSAKISQEVHLFKHVDPAKDVGFFKRMFQPQADILEFVWFQDGSLNTHLAQNLTDPTAVDAAISWGGYSNKYFFLGLVPKSASFDKLVYSMRDQKASESWELVEKQIEPNASDDYETSLYLGPKKIEELRKLAPDLDHVIQYGNWLGPISRFLLSILLFFYNLIPNYGIAIILLTIVVKSFLFPLAYKGAVSMKKLQIVQPKMKEIRDKYKSNPQRMQAEMMNLYKTEKVNPVGGCLPLLLQMPVFFALYRVFFASFEMRHAVFFGWIQDLSAFDPYFVTPIVMTGIMFLQQRITPMPGGMGEESEAVRIQKAMYKWMPLIFGGIMLFLPAGLALYILVNASISVIQQFYLNKHLQKLFPVANKPALSQVNGK